jgi:hypothetical protein
MLTSLWLTIITFLGLAQQPQSTPLNLAIQQANYERCIQLIKEKAVAEPKDLERARLMQSLELDGTDQKIKANDCVHFIEEYLKEQGKIPNIVTKRPTDMNPAQLLAHQTNTLEYKFLQAVKENNITKMNELARYVDPNTTINYLQPIDLAIGLGHQEALRYLLTLKANVTLEHVEKAKNFVDIVDSPDAHSEMTFTEKNVTPEWAQAKAVSNAKKIHKILKEHLESKNATAKN